MPLVKCPDCGHNFSSHAKACPRCAYPLAELRNTLPKLSTASQPLRKPPIGPTLHQDTDPIAELQEIAYRQKLLMYAILLNVLSIVPAFALTSHPTLFLGGWMLQLCIAAIELWCAFRLGVALNMSLPIIWLCCLALLVPCVALVPLVFMSRSATIPLQRAGLRVHLLGADLRGLQRVA
jgi:hypothetical protein